MVLTGSCTGEGNCSSSLGSSSAAFTYSPCPGIASIAAPAGAAAAVGCAAWRLTWPQISSGSPPRCCSAPPGPSSASCNFGLECERYSRSILTFLPHIGSPLSVAMFHLHINRLAQPMLCGLPASHLGQQSHGNHMPSSPRPQYSSAACCCYFCKTTSMLFKTADCAQMLWAACRTKVTM